MSHRSTPTEWLVFAALGAAWGSSYLFIKIGVETLSPFTLIAARTAIGTAVLAAAMVLARQRLPARASLYGHMFVVALLGIALPFSLITWGEQSIDSALAAIINGSVPLFAMVLAAIFLVDEPLTTPRALGLVVGLAGVVVVTSPGFSAGLGGSLGAELALVGSSVSYGASAVYARRFVRDLAALPSAFLEVGFAFAVIALLALAFEHPFATQVEPSTVLSITWLGFVGSGLAYLAFFFLLGRWGAGRTSLVAYVLPIVGAVLGVAVGHETLGLAVFAGMALVIGGVALANSRLGARRREPAVTAKRAGTEAPVNSERSIQAGD